MAHFIDVIKCDGDNSTFIWKHPCEDFNTLSQLIVHESQEAIFLMNGQALDTFGPGRYTLSTENIPILGKLINLASDGETPFHCEVYFINKTVQMSVKWGTDSKVRYIDPDSGLPLEIGACGTMNLQVCNGRKLLTKLVGTTDGIVWSREADNRTGADEPNYAVTLKQAFHPLIVTAVRSNLTAAIKANGINLFEVDEHLTDLSEILKERIAPGFEEYGLTIPQFYLTTVLLPENDPNFKREKELYTINQQKRIINADAQVRLAQAQADAEVAAARRAVELEKQATQTAIARQQAERDRIEAEAKADAARQQGFAEAQVMKAKGYTQKDVMDTDVQKTMAESFGKMGSNGGSAGGGAASDMVSMMAGMKMAGMMMDKMDGLMNGAPAAKPAPAGASPNGVCAVCGAKLPEGSKFCLECGAKVGENVSADMIKCPGCGKTVQKGKFCLECGYKFVLTCPDCGRELPENAKFCVECGHKFFITCPGCGRELPNGAGFCFECGAQL